MLQYVNVFYLLKNSNETLQTFDSKQKLFYEQFIWMSYNVIIFYNELNVFEKLKITVP